ncbi:uncharacterized protein B0T15DRAFT_510190 [Chaetomium strumarium]|uniref:lytic cellulose monooxygenase (C4-dehydrogenating) n=1 Tax=Chaetomium strumarium TaxID=1170767 RepID=A0AAJ0GVI4_9PEZI|nr:hypothetical protein B0T15DRAFT_510190 [Chaetomium strumarium]
MDEVGCYHTESVQFLGSRPPVTTVPRRIKSQLLQFVKFASLEPDDKSLLRLAAVAALAVHSVAAHYGFQQFSERGTKYPPWMYIRRNSSPDWLQNGPMTDLASSDLRCKVGGSQVSNGTEAIAMKAGDEFTFTLDTAVHHAGPVCLRSNSDSLQDRIEDEPTKIGAVVGELENVGVGVTELDADIIFAWGVVFVDALGGLLLAAGSTSRTWIILVTTTVSVTRLVIGGHVL